jgi:hypothetical protein
LKTKPKTKPKFKMNQIKKKTEKLKFFYQKGIKHRKNKEHEEHSYQF